ncbi:MAG: 1,4-dihydroxy-2-naphthoate polyprenyltransferase [Firmicutes bacterium HGW-Firmicutes-1]|jgi:1,4-dihydroxy-2-naphthoate octaprenyltransferase|nr:MAG: 1,4-dihydroxy-2-naphthoate polyprenyltransferase [Firmicutes bacterium HGW-Firmicutes-1]
MNVRSFLKLIELPTKVTCFTTLLVATVFVLYRGDDFKPINFLLMFVSLIAMDMVTTGLNNYLDFKKAKTKSGFGYEEHNAIVKYGLKESSVIATLFLLSAISGTFGILLFLKTDIIVLFIGMIAFGIGVLYTFGLVSISRTPFGELVSGLFQGFGIIFVGIYIHTFEHSWVFFQLSDAIFQLELNMAEILSVFLYSIPATLTIANIMLANNICDIEEDLLNRRYTLPIYIGKEMAIKLFASLYYLSYVAIILMVILKITPLVTLFVLLTSIIVQKNIGIFRKQQTKKDTFSLAIMNFILINGALLITVLVGVLLKKFV